MLPLKLAKINAECDARAPPPRTLLIRSRVPNLRIFNYKMLGLQKTNENKNDEEECKNEIELIAATAAAAAHTHTQ